MPNITVNDDFTSHVVSDDGASEFFMAPYNVLTGEPFTSKEQVEQFIFSNINTYNWWQPFVDPAVREQERLDAQSKAVRDERNKLLSDTDWVVVKSAETGEAIPTEWTTYRQALRDVTTQDGFPDTVVWPVKP